jgi:hypothetical protein
MDIHTINSTFTGLFVGISQAIVGHPLDTIKVWKQTVRPKVVPLKMYFNGMLAPLLTNGLVNASFFGIEKYLHNNHGLSHYTSGFISGTITSIFLCPTENWKIKMQTGHKYNLKLYRGLFPLLLRDSFSIGIYFGLYHTIRDNYDVSSFVAGGITGWVSWLTYPCDVIKTRVQADYTISLKEAINKKQLWKGFGVCSIRAILVNAVGFYTYDQLSCFLQIT